MTLSRSAIQELNRELAPSGKRCCNSCGEIKDLVCFYVRDGKPASPCKECNRLRCLERGADPEFREKKRQAAKDWASKNPRKKQARNLLKFNLGDDPVAVYEEMARAQLGVCAICGGPPGRRALNVDHDHNCCDGNFSCGECIRALLCMNCNQLLGRAHDDADVLRKAIDYLDKWRR